MMDAGQKVIWNGEEFTVFNTFEQTMVTLVDADNKAKAYPLMRVVRDVMTEAREEADHG